MTDKLEEFGQSIGDTDIGQIRYFNEPVQMYELLGFDDSDAGKPDEPRYWKNIIPETHTIFNRSGVTISGDDITIDETNPQTWTGTNEYGIGYYYPVLPKLNKYGKFNDESFELQGGNTPFGTTGRNWDEDDIYAYTTNPNITDSSLLIDIKNEEIERNVLNDGSGGDVIGIGVSDYKVKFNNETLKPNKNKRYNV